MKNHIFSICLICFLTINFSVYSQSSNSSSVDKLEKVADHNPFNDYSKQKLSNVDTIPGFDSKQNKLKIYGTIYESDGVTPAKNVILYIEQADENGDFDVRIQDNMQYVYNRGWIKTDSDGHYTFYTYVPGNDRRYNMLKELFPLVKEPSMKEYEIETFLFDDDPLLSKFCRKRIAKKSDITRILKFKEEDGLLVAQRDIILKDKDILP